MTITDKELAEIRDRADVLNPYHREDYLALLAEIERLREIINEAYTVDHDEFCSAPDGPCSCGLLWKVDAILQKAAR